MIEADVREVRLLSHRRSDYDVTNTVQVSSPDAVRNATAELYGSVYGEASFDKVDRAFQDFALLFTGKAPGYLGCDTVYHDIQHTLDMTLAMARLLAGHDKIHESSKKIGPYRATVGLITALFHDAGYIRQADDEDHKNGAEFTRYHVSRSAGFLADYLPRIGLAEAAMSITENLETFGQPLRYAIPDVEARGEPVHHHKGRTIAVDAIVEANAVHTGGGHGFLL